MKIMKILFVITLFLAGSFVFAQESGDILIKNATVLTVTNGTLENTDVLIEDGKISRIGKDLRTPKGVREVDATGKFVMPGIIDEH